MILALHDFIPGDNRVAPHQPGSMVSQAAKRVYERVQFGELAFLQELIVRRRGREGKNMSQQDGIVYDNFCRWNGMRQFYESELRLCHPQLWAELNVDRSSRYHRNDSGWDEYVRYLTRNPDSTWGDYRALRGIANSGGAASSQLTFFLGDDQAKDPATAFLLRAQQPRQVDRATSDALIQHVRDAVKGHVRPSAPQAPIRSATRSRVEVDPSPALQVTPPPVAPVSAPPQIVSAAAAPTLPKTPTEADPFLDNVIDYLRFNHAP